MNEAQFEPMQRPCPKLGKDSRFRLREFSLDDSSNVALMHSDARISELLLDDVSLDKVGQARLFIKRIRERYRNEPGLGLWAADRYAPRYTLESLNQNGAISGLKKEVIQKLIEPCWQFSGWFNLTQIAEEATDDTELHGEIELGSRLVPEVWGSRLSLMGGDALMFHAFDTLNLERVHIHCHSEHRSAVFCALYLGFDGPVQANYAGQRSLRFTLHRESYFRVREMSTRTRRRTALERMRDNGSPVPHEGVCHALQSKAQNPPAGLYRD